MLTTDASCVGITSTNYLSLCLEPDIGWGVLEETGLRSRVNRHRTPDTRRTSPQAITGPVGQLSSDLLTRSIDKPTDQGALPMRNARYFRHQATLALEIARQMSDPRAAKKLRSDAAWFFCQSRRSGEGRGGYRAAASFLRCKFTLMGYRHGRACHWCDRAECTRAVAQ